MINKCPSFKTFQNKDQDDEGICNFVVSKPNLESKISLFIVSELVVESSVNINVVFWLLNSIQDQDEGICNFKILELVVGSCEQDTSPAKYVDMATKAVAEFWPN